MTTTSPVQSLPVPEASDQVDVPGNLMALAQAIERRLVMVFANQGARDAAIPAPSAGMACCLTDSNTYQLYADGRWQTFYTGNAPGSGVSHGHISSYQTSPPANVPAGSVAVDRDDQRAYTKDNSGVWRPLAAAVPVAHVSYRYTTPPQVAEGATSQSASLTVTTTAPNQKLHISGVLVYELLGVEFFLNSYAGYQDVAVSFTATAPGGSAVEVVRYRKRDKNTGGNGSALVGGPTPQTAYLEHVYTAVTPGTYTFAMRLYVGITGGNGNVANYGGDMTIMPVVTTTTF